MNTAPKPLTGVRVLDLGRMFAAPWAGQLLADLGADVIKVERFEGDELRAYGPPFLRDEQARELRESPYSLASNRGKRSIAVDLSRAEGCDLTRRLALACDVVIENFKVGDLARKGLDHASLKALKPELIYCSITGFGQTGPYAGRPGVDTMFQAMSGLMSVTGEPDGEPQKSGVVIVDLITGLYAVVAVLAGLRHREVNGGPGQAIDLALLDAAVATTSHRAMEYLMGGRPPVRAGTGTPGNVPARIFPCREGMLSVQAGGEAQFKKLCRALDRLDWLEDERFRDRRARVAHEAVLTSLLNDIFRTRTAAEWFAFLEPSGVFCAPYYTIDQTFADPQVKHRGLRQTAAHPAAGDVALIANPIRFSETPLGAGSAPPMIGEHTAEVLAEVLGLGEAEIAALQASGVVAAPVRVYAA